MFVLVWFEISGNVFWRWWIEIKGLDVDSVSIIYDLISNLYFGYDVDIDRYVKVWF